MSSPIVSMAAQEIRHALTSVRAAITKRAATVAATAPASQSSSSSLRQVVRSQELVHPLLVAVSKTKPISAILAAYDTPSLTPPQRHFGENYVQELIEKSSSSELQQSGPDAIQWHLIGHLQTNKCKSIARIPNLALVESIDSIKLASALNAACVSVKRESPLPVLIQVNTSGEVSKFGCRPEEALDLFGHVLNECPRLAPRGLMTIGRLAETPQPDCFDLLVDIRKSVLAKFARPTSAAASTSSSESTSSAVNASAVSSTPSSTAAASSSSTSSSQRYIDPSTFEMSMGMSGDYELAIDRGATIIRIGSTIFGARDYSQKEEKEEKANTPAAKEETK